MQANATSNYIVKRLDLITNQEKRISLIGVFSELRITEDLFSNYLHGTLSFADANDLHQSAPIIGEEYIEFVYTTDDITHVDVSLRFRVYRIESSEDNQDRIAHILYLVSDEAFLNANTTISKSYKAKPIQFIVNDAFSKISNSKVKFGDFVGQYHIVSPNWSPLQLINYTASFAKPKNYNGSLVLFYQTVRGFEYRHIEELYTRPSLGTWKANVTAKHDMPNERDEINPSNTIIKYNIIKNSSDTLLSINDGMYANAVQSYDNVSKTFITHRYDYDKMFDKTIHLNDFKLNSKSFADVSAQQRISYLPSMAHRTSSNYFKQYSDGLNLAERKEEILPWRTSLIAQMNAKQIQITVPGNEDLNVGKVITIELPNTSLVESQRNSSHRYNKKNVLISKVINNFTRKTHTMDMLVVDDTYSNGVESLPEFDKATNA